VLEGLGRAIPAGMFTTTLAENTETLLMRINHFAAMLLFAALISVAFAALGQRNGRERFRYAIWSFALFVLIGVGIAWIMYPFSH
jgi:hypothetical protein